MVSERFLGIMFVKFRTLLLTTKVEDIATFALRRPLRYEEIKGSYIYRKVLISISQKFLSLSSYNILYS